MIFKKNIHIEFDENIIKKNRIPILIRDRQWKDIMKSNKNKNVDSLSKELEELLNSEKMSLKKISVLKEKKKKIMEKILLLSDQVHSQGSQKAIAEIESNKDEIMSINNEIEEEASLLEDYPQKIENKNLQLVKETIISVYGEIIESQSRFSFVEKEIQELREKLALLRTEKEELEQKKDSLYSFLHMMVGHEEMEKLDQFFFKE